MRHLSSKIYCPIICFCKSSSHIYTPQEGSGSGGGGGKGSGGDTVRGSLKSGSSNSSCPQNQPVSPPSDVSSSPDDQQFSTASDEEEKVVDAIQKSQELPTTNGVCDHQNGHHHSGGETENGHHHTEGETENGLKSSLRKVSPDSEIVEKKKVQWLDSTGQGLVQVKEFECSDTGDDYRSVNRRSCFCSIL